MPVSIERLRSSMLVLAVLLVVGILLVFGYARWEARRVVRDLPAKLGISVQRSTNGFDISKSEGGRTLFTLHAAKMVQYTGRGQAVLHGVSITLYGPDGTPTDRIYGDDFAYDPSRSVVRANGAVQIDLQGPATSAGNVVHVKTADLVFDQKTGLATTSQPIDFRVSGVSGSATGASFNAHTGICILNSKVAFDSSLRGNALEVRAGHAQFDRADRRLYLLDDEADYQSAHSSSDQATVAFRPDGYAYRIDLQGHVKNTKEGQSVLSPEEQVNLDGKSQPQQAFLNGGVVYMATEPARQLHGTAVSGTLTFGPGATIRHAQLKNAVSIVDVETPPSSSGHGGRAGTAANSYESTNREVEASQIDVDFEQTGGRSLASQILAQGGAALNVRTLYAKTPPQETQIRADRIFLTLRDGVALSTVRGDGHTKLVMASSNGVTQTSTGDRLLMDFASAAKRKREGAVLAAPQRAASLESAEQEGNVVFIQQAAKTSTVPADVGDSYARSSGTTAVSSGEIRATAQRAIFNAAKNTITLNGGAPRGAAGEADGQPRVEQAGGALMASTIEFERATGDATATGDVQATYRQTSGPGSGSALGGSEPVHVVAARAHLERTKELTFFYGASGRDARLWQGADSVSAPVLELAGAQRTLAAHGAAGSSDRPVRVVLSNSGAAGPAENEGSAQKGSAAKEGQPGLPSIVRVSSGSLFYSDKDSEARFRGGVVMLDSAGAIRCNAMDVSLGPKNGVRSSGSSGGKQVERIVARDQVLLEQPGRRATGSDLVYTAKDGKFVLTGTDTAPPRLTDEAHGTVTGTSLIFNSRDDSVMVSGGSSRAVAETKK